MKARRNWILGLYACTLPGAIEAQPAVATISETSQPKAPEDSAPTTAGVPARRVILGDDEQALPPGLLQKIEEQLKAEEAAKPEGAAPAAPRIRILGADGKPVPPEVARRLQEQFKDLIPPDADVDGAQNQGSPEEPTEQPPIVVSSQRSRGAIDSDIPPERTFGQLDIRSLGAENIAAVLDNIASQTASNRGRGDSGPVTLLNGRRVADFAEIARIPSEAIERMDIFSEEVALQFGYRADQKVVNIVTYANYQSRIGQASALVPGEGGRESWIANADYLQLAGDTRIGLGASYSRAGQLLESKRDIRQFLGAPELATARTLLPATENLGINGVLSGHLMSDIVATMNGRVDVNRNDSLLGAGGGQALRRGSDRTLVHLGTTISGKRGRWQWSALANLDRTEAEILTDVGGVGIRRDAARSTDTLANADFLASGPLATLPAGPLTASVRVGAEFRDFSSRASVAGIELETDLGRDRGAAQVNLGVPLLGEADGKASPLGNLAVNANAAFERLSDAGSLWTYGFGFNWSPAKGIDLVASVTREEGAPALEQLGGPLIVTPNVRTFDFARREVVDLARISGGNAALVNDDRQLVRLGLNLHPLAKTDLSFSIDYVRTRIDNPIAPFPIVTPQVEAAFPDRFTRNGSGQLLTIDARPINFAAARQQQLRWGVNFTRPLGQVPEFMRDARVRVLTSEAEARRLYPNAQMARAQPGSATFQAASNLTSRFYVSLYHNWYLEDEIALRAGLPTLDLLEDGAVDFLGGRRRHEIDFQAGVFKRGLGARLSASWKSGARIGDAGAAAGDLRFGDLTIVNLNLFANLSERFGGADAPRWLKGVRASIGVTNLFNTRPQVRDDAGATPLSYQSAYLDPLGRVFSFGLRKIL
ncbi:TonB-dependent receptor [Blastomonas sp.]|uniref:TonB-dependent receptor n=1 Tax=Blastomonas sp. TaxID=1909299 RepID=UPI00391AFB2B